MITLVEHIQNLIKQNKMERALEALESWAEGNDTDLHNTVIMQSARLNELRKNERMGILGQDDAYRTTNQIRYAVLSMLDELPKEIMVDGSTGKIVSPVHRAEDQSTPTPFTRKLFISYAREDYEYVKGLEKHLSVLIRSKHIDSWSDSQILPGQEWNEEIRYQLEAADIILYMVSADFLSSDYINRHERVWAEENRARNNALIVPVLVRPCFWQEEPFAQYGGLPKSADGQLKPISQWNDLDSAYLNVVMELKRIIDSKG